MSIRFIFGFIIGAVIGASIATALSSQPEGAQPEAGPFAADETAA